MNTGKLITGLAIGAVAALILVPKTRKMLADAVSGITDSLKEMMEKANTFAHNGQNELSSMADNMGDKTKNIAEKARATKESWQS